MDSSYSDIIKVDNLVKKYEDFAAVDKNIPILIKDLRENLSNLWNKTDLNFVIQK